MSVQQLHNQLLLLFGGLGSLQLFFIRLMEDQLL
jgi:hypothetical protein